MSILGRFIRENPDKLTISVFIIGSVTVGDFKNLGTIGNLNFQGTQIAESIDVKIGKLREEDNGIADALRELTVAVAAETVPLSEDQRNELLEQIEMLGEQAAMPMEKRKKGLIKPIVEALASVCTGAGGLAVVWQTWGPAIMRFFGI